jgi:hypothetical protein
MIALRFFLGSSKKATGRSRQSLCPFLSLMKPKLFKVRRSQKSNDEAMDYATVTTEHT